MITVVCVKHGKKYSADYVNKLYRGVSRNLTVPFKFVCFTDDSTDVECETRILPQLPITGWWWKLYLFSKDLLEGTVLFLDLDMVIVGSLDKIIDFSPGKFIGMRDVFRAIRPEVFRLGSAVMRWEGSAHSALWDDFISDYHTVMAKYRGDQNWIWDKLSSEIQFFPDEWVVSYKWEIRNRSEAIRTPSGWIFKDARSPVIPCQTSVLAFHGTPTLCSVRDKVILDHWC